MKAVWSIHGEFGKEFIGAYSPYDHEVSNCRIFSEADAKELLAIKKWAKIVSKETGFTWGK